MTASHRGLAWIAALLFCADPGFAQESNPAAELEAPTVEVVGTTPLDGLGTPINQVPANVQAITGSTIEQQQSQDLPGFLDDNIGSVSLNSGQANRFMPDLNFRGFQGSPLLGVPQGISAFQDGVRINEAFGDTINWDLIPESAISTINLIPGSNPVFGLNTLGGALAVNMKSGKEYPGGSVMLEGGSWGYKQGGVEFGGKAGAFDYYINGNYQDENGWREHSPSQIEQVFGKVGYETADFDADLSYSFANNTLQGTQASPLPLLDFNPALAYTYPDIQKNRLNFVNLRLSKVLGSDKILSGDLYYRKLQSSNVGSNVNDLFDGTAPGTVCNGSPGDSACPASNDSSETDTDGMGAALQFTWLAPVASRDNKLTIGMSYDGGDTTFTQAEQLAVFTLDRQAVGVSPFVLETDVDTTNRYYGVYFTDTLSINEKTFLTLSGRYNQARISIRDNTGLEPALNGDHTFSRFNPAVGLNWNPSVAVNTWFTYNQGMRAPTAVELTCADPTAPCKLPNAFLADPPLEAVVSKTFELGTRGNLTPNLFYSAALFRTTLDDDIQFVSSTSTGTLGFFQNVGQTRRQGLELGLQSQIGKLGLKAAYSYIDATFQTPFTVSSQNNSSADASGNIQVQPGDRIPGIPRNNFKLRTDYAFTPRIFGGLTMVYASSQYARGDDNNQDVNGPVPGYVVFNLDGRWNITEQLQIFGQITNLFDRTYQILGVLGENFFQGPNFTYDPSTAASQQFRTPGAPRAFYVGVRYQFARPPKTASGNVNH